MDPQLKHCLSQDCMLSNSIFDAEHMYDSVRVKAMKKEPKYSKSLCSKNSKQSDGSDPIKGSLRSSELSSSVYGSAESESQRKMEFEAPYYHAIMKYS